MSRVFKLLKVRSVLYGAIIFCIALQPLFTNAALALGEPSEPLGVPGLAVPSGGKPHDTTQTTGNFSFSWNPVIVEPAVEYQLRISDSQTQVGEVPDSSDAWYSQNLPSPSMPATMAPLHDGMWYWQVRAVTAATKGNWSEVWNVQIDTVGPVLSITQPLEGVLGNTPVSFNAEITDSNSVASFAVELDGQVVTDQITQTSTEMGLRLNKEWAHGQLAEGSHTIKVTASDNYGHSTELTRLFAIDTTPPEITVSALENQVITGIVPVEVHGNEPGTYAIRISSGEKEIFAGSSLDAQAGSTLSYSHSWNTWDGPSGAYEIRFTGKDAVGNEASIVRHVTIANAITSAEITKDPLLEELSAQLSQPLVMPKVVETPVVMAAADPPKVNDLSQEQEVLLKTVPEFVPVAATENGWRLFGILWYWWLLGGLVLASSCMVIKRYIRTSPSQVPDRV